MENLVIAADAHNPNIMADGDDISVESLSDEQLMQVAGQGTVGYVIWPNSEPGQAPRTTG